MAILRGVDISKFQGDIDFGQLKTAIDFVIIKSSSGAPDPGQTATQYADSKFAHNRDEARRLGIPRGWYHFVYPEVNAPEAEAQCFHDVVGELQVGEFMVLDYESSWGGNKQDWCLRFLETLSELYGGYKPLIYLNLSTALSGDWSLVSGEDYGLWLARWDYDPNAPAPTTVWPVTAFRQYSNHERISGIATDVDGDIFYGDMTALARYGYSKPIPPPPPPDPCQNVKDELRLATENIGGLKTEIANRDTTIASLESDIDDLDSAIADQKAVIEELKTQSTEAIKGIELIVMGIKKIFSRKKKDAQTS